MFQSVITAIKLGTHQTVPWLKILLKKHAVWLIMTMNTVLLQEMLANGHEDAVLELRMIVRTNTTQTMICQPLTKLSVTMICATLWTPLPPQDLLILQQPLLILQQPLLILPTPLLHLLVLTVYPTLHLF